MKGVFATLGLSPQERRLVVGVMVVVFVFLNFWLVWPHFNDWKAIEEAKATASEKLAKWEREAALKASLQTKLIDLEDNTEVMPSSGQAVDMAKKIARLISDSGVNATGTSPANPGRPLSDEAGKFFEEKAYSVSFDGADGQVVQFLHSLGTSNSNLRVRQLDIYPGQGQTNLTARMVVVGSYQRDEPLASKTK